MVVVELIAIKGMVSLANHLHKQRQQLRTTVEKEDKEEADDSTLATSASTLAAATTCTTSCRHSHEEGEDKVSHHPLHHDDDDDQLMQHEEDDTSSVYSCLTTSTAAGAATTLLQSGHCSFRPMDDNNCLDISSSGDTAAGEFENLEISNHDIYHMTQRCRRGGEEADLEVAIQAAIYAQALEKEMRKSRSRSTAPTKRRIQRPTQPPLLVNLLQTGTVRWKRNMGTIAERVTHGSPTRTFVQARVDTFSRNVATLSMMARGKCERPWDKRGMKEKNDGEL